MAEEGFYKMWQACTHAIPRLQRYQRVGIMTSYPVFAYTDAGLQIRHFYYSGEQIGADTVMIGPPRILVTLAYETYDIVNVDFEPFDLPLFENVEYTLGAEERAAKRPFIAQLEAQYDRLLAPYPEPPETKVVEEFGTALQRVVPPVLWPYYELLQRGVTRVER
jgi:hypothetical protein